MEARAATSIVKPFRRPGCSPTSALTASACLSRLINALQSSGVVAAAEGRLIERQLPAFPEESFSVGREKG
jgi:hypothetical protein